MTDNASRNMFESEKKYCMDCGSRISYYFYYYGYAYPLCNECATRRFTNSDSANDCCD